MGDILFKYSLDFEYHQTNFCSCYFNINSIIFMRLDSSIYSSIYRLKFPGTRPAVEIPFTRQLRLSYYELKSNLVRNVISPNLEQDPKILSELKFDFLVNIYVYDGKFIMWEKIFSSDLGRSSTHNYNPACPCQHSEVQ